VIPAEVILTEVRRLLEAMGLRAEPKAVTPQVLQRQCQRIEKARWSRAPAVAHHKAQFLVQEYREELQALGLDDDG